METLACLSSWSAGHDVPTVCISPDSSTLISGSADSSLKVWDISGVLKNNGEAPQCLRVLQGHRTRVISVCITSDGSKIVSCSYDAKLRVWSNSSNAVDRQPELVGHPCYLNAMCFTSDSSTLLSGSIGAH